MSLHASLVMFNADARGACAQAVVKVPVKKASN